ncbi:UbiA family prenyltransferase [Actinomadura madurae]|nr:UbiA family prenyltransferase [Actinomadura madurae]
MPDTVRWLHVKALQLEASLWMGRVHLQGLLMFIFMGWWAGAAPGESASLVPLAGLCAFVVLGSAAMQIVNDLGDIEGDRVTAPYLPLPAGLLTQRAAGLAACGYLGAGSFVLWWTLPHWRWFVAVLAMVAASLAAFRLYSAVKPLGVITSVIIAFPMGFPLIWAWLVAGHHDTGLFAVLLAYTTITFVSGNIITALHDVDLDEQAGNRSYPVRVGAPAAFRFMIRMVLSSWLLVLIIFALADQAIYGLPFAFASLALLAVSYQSVLKTLAEQDRGRLRRIDDLGPIKISDQLRHAAVLAALAPDVSLATFTLIQVVAWTGHYLYRRRVVRGGIRRSLQGLQAMSAS